MVLPNPKKTYKAQLLDYDALIASSDDECCYSLSEREINMLMPFIDYIAWKTRYIATETEIDPVLIERWAGNLARKLMSGCCPDEELHRFTEQGIYQSSDDGGVTWHDDPLGDPRNSGTAAPPLPGEPSDGKRCAAADNVRGLFEQYRDNLIEIVGATPSILAIIAGILALIGTLLGISGVGIGIGVLFFGMAAEMIQIGGVGISGAITFTALLNFRCMVYCRMDDNGELTYDAWQGLLSDIADGFSGFAETFFYQTVSGMGYIGVNNAGTIGSATADDCGDCDCACGGETVGETLVTFHGDEISRNGCNIKVTATADGDHNAVTVTWDGTHPWILAAEGLIPPPSSPDTGTSTWQYYTWDGSEHGPFTSGTAPIGISVTTIELFGTPGHDFSVSWDVATP